MAPRVHLICNAHLDPVWLWRWQEGCAEALATFRNAVELLREHENFIFNHNEAVLYRWVETYDPGLFTEIQRLVAAGRWCIGGGWYLQPDLNLPDVESLVRHITEGRAYFADRFDAFPRVAYNFDSFGHPAGLPQLLKQSGVELYIHMRPQAADLELPGDLYRWRGKDGSEVAAYRIAVGLYHTERDNILDRIREGVALAQELDRDVPVFWGLGNHGGGATRADLEVIDEAMVTTSSVEIKHSSTENLWQALAASAATAPVVEGELQRVFTGCYTSLSRIKRRARRNLGRLVHAEAVSTAAWWLLDAPYPGKELTDAWQDHLFNDFHDILPGTCIEPAETDALDLYGRSAETTRRLRFAAATAFARTGREATLPVSVLHANPAATHAPVEVEFLADYRPVEGEWHHVVMTEDGEELPSQELQPEALLPFNGWRRRVVFVTDLAAVGATHFHIERKAGPAPVGTTHTEPRVAEVGDLLQPIVVRDTGDAWGEDQWSYRDVLGRFELERGPAKTSSGAVCDVRETEWRYQNSRIHINNILYHHDEVTELRLRIHWAESQQRLKLSWPTGFAEPKLECEVPGGLLACPADGAEHVVGRWLLLTGTAAGKPQALGIAHDGQHGVDFRDGELRMSVLRSAAYCHQKDFDLDRVFAPKWMDQGEHEVRLLVTTGEPAAVRSRLPGLADRLDRPSVAIAHLPRMGEESSQVQPFLTIEPPSVRMLACKPDRTGRSLLVRLFETSGNGGHVVLRLGAPKLCIDASLSPHEIRTYRIERDGTWSVVDILDRGELSA